MEQASLQQGGSKPPNGRSTEGAVRGVHGAWCSTTVMQCSKVAPGLRHPRKVSRSSAQARRKANALERALRMLFEKRPVWKHRSLSPGAVGGRSKVGARALGMAARSLRLRVAPRRMRNCRPMVAAQPRCGAAPPSRLVAGHGGPGTARGHPRVWAALAPGRRPRKGRMLAGCRHGAGGRASGAAG